MTTALLQPAKRTVPRSALRFTAPPVTMVDLGLQFSADSGAQGAGDDGAPAPSTRPKAKQITIRARTNGEAYQGYWGRCVHDMSGFIPPTGPIPLDWQHNDEQVEDIGLVDTFTVDDEGLLCTGRLIPFTDDDRANEIIYKGGEGVPYQASITLDLSTLVITEVPDGVTYNVNSQDFVGPLIVFNQWGIEGIAVVLYGADSGSSIQFSAGGDVSVTVQSLPLKDDDMSVKTDPTPAATPPAPAPAPVIETKPAGQLPAEARQFSFDEANKFKSDFGAKGVDWYLEGKPYPEAAKLFAADKQAEIEALKADLAKKNDSITAITKERDEAKAKAEFRRGHPTPVKVDPTADPNAKTEPQASPAHFGRTKGMDAFVGAVSKKLEKINE